MDNSLSFKISFENYARLKRIIDRYNQKSFFKIRANPYKDEIILPEPLMMENPYFLVKVDKETFDRINNAVKSYEINAERSRKLKNPNGTPKARFPQMNLQECIV